MAMRKTSSCGIWGTVLAVTLTLPLLAGCSESSPPANPDGSTGGGGQGGGAGVACDAPNLYFKKVGGDGCGASICHADAFPDLTSGDADSIWQRLYNQPNQLSPTCADMKLIIPQKPADGVLLRRLKGMDCGPITMPKDRPFPAQAAIDCVTSWVNARLP